MDQIDYRTLADERADEFLAEHFPFQNEHTEIIRTAYKMGFVDGHITATDSTLAAMAYVTKATLEEPGNGGELIMKYNEDGNSER